MSRVGPAIVVAMSGQPMRRSFDQALEARGKADGLADPDGTLTPGEVWFFGQVASGVKMGALAETMGVSRPWLYTWMKLGGRGPEREAAYAVAKRAAADYHAEAAGEVLDQLDGDDPTSAMVSLAGKRSDHHRWLATVLDRDQYGPKGQEVNVNLDLGQLHIQALTEVADEWAEAEVVEAEVVDDATQATSGEDEVVKLLQAPPQ